MRLPKLLLSNHQKNVIFFNIIKILGLYSINPLIISESKKNNSKYGCIITKVKFVHEIYENIQYKWIEQTCYTLNKSKRSKNKIVVLHLKNLR